MPNERDKGCLFSAVAEICRPETVVMGNFEIVKFCKKLQYVNNGKLSKWAKTENFWEMFLRMRFVRTWGSFQTIKLCFFICLTFCFMIIIWFTVQMISLNFSLFRFLLWYSTPGYELIFNVCEIFYILNYMYWILNRCTRYIMSIILTAFGSIKDLSFKSSSPFDKC